MPCHPLILGLLAVLLAGCMSSDDGDRGSSVRITQEGVEGAKPQMSLEEVQAQWDVTLPTVGLLGPGSSGTAIAAICWEGALGAAIFQGPDSSPTDTLRAVWFVEGAETDAGVGIGSTLTDLRRAYGPRLRWHSLGLASVNGFIVLGSGPPPRTAIIFAIETFGGRGVDAIGHGYRDDIESVDPILDVFC